MPWNAGTFTRIHEWSADAASGIDILASRMDQEDDNFASGISQCLNVNGENTLLSDISMAGKKWTNCGEATLQNQYPTAGQVQLGELNYGGTTTGASENEYVVTEVGEDSVVASVASWRIGFQVVFKPHQTNDGPATLSVNGSTPVSITCLGAGLLGGELVVNQLCVVAWNGTWVLLSPSQKKISDTALATPIGVKGYLTADTAAFGITVGTSNEGFLTWDELQWDDAPFLPGGPPGDTFIIPSMPDTPSNEARFDIRLSLFFRMLNITDAVIESLTAMIWISQNAGLDFYNASGSNGMLVIAGDLNNLGNLFNVHADFQMEMKTTDQLKFGWRFATAGAPTVNTMQMQGNADIIDASWCSITRMG